MTLSIYSQPFCWYPWRRPLPLHCPYNSITRSMVHQNNCVTSMQILSGI